MESQLLSGSRVDKEVVRRVPTSRYKGVTQLRHCCWGSRIYHMDKSYWLGTYRMEDEAAVAYDRAAIKLKGTDFPLNFHRTRYSAEETIFLSQYSSGEILKLIKNKTYSSILTSFLSCRASGMEIQTRTFLNAQRISYHLIFEKEITHGDANGKCLRIPRHALPYFSSPNGISSSGGDARYQEITFYDIHGHSWILGYSYCQRSWIYAFTTGWRLFMNMYNLNQKDKVLFYRCEYETLGRYFYMIDFHRRDGGNSVVGRNIERGRDWGGNMDLNLEEQTETTSKGFKLFGVQISG